MSLFPKNSDVLELTPKDFVKSNGKIYINHPKIKGYKAMMLISASWCGHCKALKQPYANAAGQLKNVFVLANVDAVKYPELVNSLAVAGFPTIKYIDKNGVPYKDFKGERTVSGILEDICQEAQKCTR
jgi:thiol-disulfide isomerase/thioredoxin